MPKRVWLDYVPDRRAANWEEIANELKANRGRWMLLFEQAPASLARAIAQGSIAALRRNKGFQVTTRNNRRDKPRLCDIYLSYRPTDKSPEQEAANHATDR